LVNVLDCCSESLLRADVTAITLRPPVPCCMLRVAFTTVAPTGDRLGDGRLVTVTTQ